MAVTAVAPFAVARRVEDARIQVAVGDSLSGSPDTEMEPQLHSEPG